MTQNNDEKETSLFTPEEVSKPLSLEQAGNLIAEKKKNMVSILRNAEYTAPTDVSTSKVTSEMLAVVKHFIPPSPMRVILGLRIKGGKSDEIAKYFKMDEQQVLTLEKKGLDLIKKSIQKEPAYRVLGADGKIISGKPGRVGL